MAADLSNRHEPMTELFPRPATRDEWERYKLSDEQVAFFHENGYLANIKILEPPQIEALRSDLAGFFDPGHDGRDLWYEYHTNESGDPNNVPVPCARSVADRPGDARCALESRFHRAGQPTARRRGPLLARSTLLQTGPTRRRGRVASGLFLLDPHQARWLISPAGWGSTIRPKTTAASTTSPRVIAGICCRPPTSPTTWDAIQSVLNDEQKEAFKPVAIEMNAGYACFHHPLMMHGSYENRTERPPPRRGPQHPSATASSPPTKANRSSTASRTIPQGEKMQGRFFPLLFDPAQIAG